jgi:putative membrane protein
MVWELGYIWPVILLMILGMTLWILLLVGLIWALVRWLTSKTTSSSLHDRRMPTIEPSAMEILRQRYARGEIDHTTFEQMRERLEASGARDHQPTVDSR